MLKHDFLSDVGYWVHMCAHRFEILMNAELASEGISFRQFQVLAWLAVRGQLSQIELARCCGVEPSTIVAVVDRMERDGLIERTVCPDDRRKHRIVPTSAAEPVWSRVVKCGAKVKKCATAGLTEAELAQLRSLLERMHTNLEEHQSIS